MAQEEQITKLEEQESPKFSNQFSEKLKSKVTGNNIPSYPLVSAHKKIGSSEEIYTVNILAYIPEDATKLTIQKDIVMNFCDFPLYYLGAENVTSEYEKRTISSRYFGLGYQFEDKNEEEEVEYGLYRLKFDYKLMPSTKSVEAVTVWSGEKIKDPNVVTYPDPETERGTVSTPIYP